MKTKALASYDQLLLATKPRSCYGLDPEGARKNNFVFCSPDFQSG